MSKTSMVHAANKEIVKDFIGSNCKQRNCEKPPTVQTANKERVKDTNGSNCTQRKGQRHQWFILQTNKKLKTSSAQTGNKEKVKYINGSIYKKTM